MNITWLDWETSDVKEGKKRNPSPFLKDNFVVSFGLKVNNEPSEYYFLNHNEFDDPIIRASNIKKLQETLDNTALLVAFNIKFELEWLLEIGLKYDGPVYDPMVVEYILARGVSVDLDLASCCTRRGTVNKLGGIISDYWDNGFSFNQMPMAVVKEYGIRDVDCIYELYYAQQKLLQEPENITLLPTIKMSNEFIWCLVDMERNGIYIDRDALLGEKSIKEQFEKEKKELELDIRKTISEVMGDTPINLNSPEQLSWLIYSRRVTSKDEWKNLFNIGTDSRGKRLRPPRMPSSDFLDNVRKHTEILKRTEATQCDVCAGNRVHSVVLKSGKSSSKISKCRKCNGLGYLLVNTEKVAGFKFTPRDIKDTSTGGFSTDKETLADLINRYAGDARYADGIDFLKKVIKYGAIDTYLNTFVDGISRNLRDSSVLHTQLMQCITRTARLSSQSPNFQNMPRARTFPVRRAVVSRFPGGKIIEVDFKTLEFVAAAYIYQDKRAIEDIKNGVDVHAFTSKTLTEAGQNTDRQGAKPHTFKPLYGGTSGTEAEQAYYKAFKDKYKGITEGQEKDIRTALKGLPITLPSGRQYVFPGTRRTLSGYVVNTTQICNYPVQGFATADIVPCALIELRKAIINAAIRSIIILTVHDSAVFDTSPGEVELVYDIITKTLTRLPDVLFSNYGIVLNVPLGFEIKIGDNWMEMK